MLKVRVPATSANLGPGFDCAGIALQLYNELYFYEATERGRDELPREVKLLPKSSLAQQGMDLVAKTCGKVLPEFKIAIKALIPKARGLGSSATLTVAGIVAANLLLDARLPEEELISLASAIEGHPDNAAPALLGGLVLSVSAAEQLEYLKVTPRYPLQAVVAVPDFELATHEARKALPAAVAHGDAVFNTGRFGLFIGALLTGEYQLLKNSMADRLHQPYRMPLVPGLQEVMAAAVSGGALGSCLSGAGPSVLALCNCNAEKMEKIKKRMQETWKQFGISAKTYLLEISATGTEIFRNKVWNQEWK